MTQFCAEPGCAARVLSGRCLTHQRAHRNTRPHYPGEQWYDSARWKRLRWDVIRATPFCVVCASQDRRRLATEIDHIRKHDGDPVLFWDFYNLQALCRPCHTAKTARGE